MPNDNLTTGLNALRALEAKATQGTWLQSAECAVILTAEDSIYGLGVADFDWGHLNGNSADEWQHEQLPNAQLVAALRNTFPQLLSVIEAAAGVNQVLEEVDWRDGCERVNPQAIHAAQSSLDDALSELAAVLPKGE